MPRKRIQAHQPLPEGTPSFLRLSGEGLDIEAVEGDAQAPARFKMIANTGRPMMLPRFSDPVIVDLTGAKFDRRTTVVLADHDTKQRVGHTLEQVIIPAGGTATLNGKEIKGPVIAAYGVASASTEVSKGFVSDSRNGFPFQTSIGADIDDGYYVPADKKVTVNGKSWSGPLIVASKTSIRELSVTVLGADHQTSATLAAIASHKEPAMDPQLKAFIENVLGLTASEVTDEQLPKIKAHWEAHKSATATPPADPPVPTPTPNPAPTSNTPDLTATRKAEADELRRISAIRAAAKPYEGKVTKTKITVNNAPVEMDLPALTAHAVEQAWTVDQFDLACLRASYGNAPEGPGIPAIHVHDRTMVQDALQAAVCREIGLPLRAKNPCNGIEYGLELMFKPEVLEASHAPQYRGTGSVQTLLAMQIAAAGMHAPHDRRSKDFLATAVKAWERIRASGFSTIDVPNVLENVMHKAMVAAFQGVETVWQFICGRRTLNDFRDHNLYRVAHNGGFMSLAPDGTLKHISLTDEKKSIAAETRGLMMTLDYKTIRNDDLGVLVDMARGIGTLGGQRIEEDVFVLLLSNPGSFFHANNSNLLTGAGSALSVTSLASARDKFRLQTLNGRPILTSPRILLVPTTLEDTANRLWAEEKLAATGDTDALVFVNNPHKGLYRPYISPYVNNTGITKIDDGGAITGQSDTKWWLLGDPNSPQGACIYIGFLDSREQPFFDESETQFDVPRGMQFRSYFDFGVAMGFTQMGVQSDGA